MKVILVVTIFLGNGVTLRDYYPVRDMDECYHKGITEIKELQESHLNVEVQLECIGVNE